MNDHHTETRRQELSALMDGELSHDRAQFALKGLAEDEAVARQWSRLHLLRHYLREAEVRPVSVHFLAAVHARLDADDADHDQVLPEENESAAWTETPAAAGNRFWSGWPQRVAGLAVAASVTMLALFGFNTLVLQPGESMPTATTELIASNPGDAGTPDNAGNTAAQGFAPRGNVLQDQFNAKAIPVNYSRDNADFRQQLNEYMLRHSQLASGSGRIGFTAYAPLLSADVEWSEEAMTSVADSDQPRRVNTRTQALSKPVRSDLE